MSLNCSKCDSPVTGKFCGKCGTKVDTVDAAVVQGAIAGSATNEGFVSWNFLPGEIARRLSSTEISELAKGLARGYIIAEGQRALIYCNGQLVAESGPGRYPALTQEAERRLAEVYNKREGGLVSTIGTAVSAVIRFLLGSSQKEDDTSRAQGYQSLRTRLAAGQELTVSLVRSAPFITQHVIKDVRTKDISCDVAFSLKVMVGDIKAFHGELLTDTNIVTQSGLETYLLAPDSKVGGQLAEFTDMLQGYTVDELQTSGEIKKTLSARLQELSPASIKVLQLVQITAKREELEQVRREMEANLIAEKQLENLVNTNRLCNRFQLESNKRAIEEARSDDELAAAMQVINSDGLLRQEQADNLVRDIQKRSEEHEMSRAQATRMIQASNELDYQKERLVYEEQIVNRQLEINRKRQADEAAHAIEMDKNRRDFERNQDVQDLDVLAKMQSVKDEQHKREHERELEKQRLEREHELAAARQANLHQVETIKQFAGMTAEQIMVANPNLSPEQAAAMAEIAKSKAEVARADDRVDLVREMQKGQQEFVANVLGSVTQALGSMSAAKDAELKRTIQSTDKAEDRMMRMVNTTVSSVSRPGNPSRSRPESGKPADEAKTCPGCGTAISSGLKFCPECGGDSP